jgi:glycosyltransferase involved in cell wall biosynthesis
MVLSMIFALCGLLALIMCEDTCIDDNRNHRNIAYFVPELNERGTALATFDYAEFNKKFIPELSNAVIIYSPEKKRNALVESRFISNFGADNVISLSWDNVTPFLLKHNVTYLYVLNPEKNIRTNHIPMITKLLLHFSFDQLNFPGRCDACAKISPVLRGDMPVVPHIVRQDRQSRYGPNMRSELNISSNATVFCRYGGWKQFDALFVKETVRLLAGTDKDKYFVFVNTEPFSDTDPRSKEAKHIIYLDAIIDLEEKSRFIRTCDAMLHARSRGESFGLAVAEFSAHNKPVITYDRGRAMTERHHINTLGTRGLTFKNSVELWNILQNFNRSETALREWNAYENYSPEKVCKIFREIFLNMV